jgi:hypothetical protein
VPDEVNSLLPRSKISEQEAGHFRVETVGDEAEPADGWSK